MAMQAAKREAVDLADTRRLNEACHGELEAARQQLQSALEGITAAAAQEEQLRTRLAGLRQQGQVRASILVRQAYLKAPQALTVACEGLACAGDRILG
jgi:hypothetical protein